MKKPELPFFGPYTTVPNWFINYCMPIIAPSSAVLWLVFLSKCRWKQGKLTVSLPVRGMGSLCGFSKNTAESAVSELIGNDLLSVPTGKTGRRKKTYTVILYTPEQARLKFKTGAKSLSQKEGQESVPVLGTKTA